MRLNNRGFGLIELIAVMAILSIIVLFAVPNFSPYINYSKEKELTQELAKIEYEIKRIIIKGNTKSWNIVKDDGVEKDLWTSNGKELDVSGHLIEVPKEVIDTELSGGFYLMNGRVYYSMSKLNVIEQPEEPIEPGPIEPEPVIVNKEKLLSSINIAKGLSEEDYESGFLALKAALSNAEKAYLDKQSSQAKIDRLQLILDRAISQLVEIPQ